MPEMNREEFTAWAIESIKNYLPDSFKDAEIDILPLAKTGKSYSAMAVRREGETTVPAIDLDEHFQAYQDGIPLHAIGAHMAEVAQMESPSFNTSIFDSYETIKKNLFIRVCNIDDNKEMLKTVPHKRVANLAITYHVMVYVGDEGISSAMVTSEMMEDSELTLNQLHEDALKNSQEILPARIDSLMNIMSGLTDVDMESIGIYEQPQMVVVTNQIGINGAAALFYPGVMERVSERLHGSYYVLPSSVHEVIAVPATRGSDYRQLEQMVKDINEMSVARDEQLGNTVYRYDEKTRIFETAAAHVQQERLSRHKAKEMER